MSQVILQTFLLDGYLIPYTSYGRFNLRFGCSIHVSKCILRVWFFKADLLSFCRCSFLSLQLILPSKGCWEGVKWNFKEWHNTVLELEGRGGSLKHSCKSLFRDGKNQASCVLWMKAAVSGTADASHALFWCGQCAGMGLTFVMETHVSKASGTLGLVMRNAALVSQVLGQERLLKHLFVHGEKYLLLGVLLP